MREGYNQLISLSSTIISLNSTIVRLSESAHDALERVTTVEVISSLRNEITKLQLENDELLRGLREARRERQDAS
jgi:hypothetical protein